MPKARNTARCTCNCVLSTRKHGMAGSGCESVVEGGSYPPGQVGPGAVDRPLHARTTSGLCPPVSPVVSRTVHFTLDLHEAQNETGKLWDTTPPEHNTARQGTGGDVGRGRAVHPSRAVQNTPTNQHKFSTITY
ncbi:hypothetical protein Bbelb_316930 [Branchiostoma belcheri]|nr:hypothetical protein Bbelb_316930 [Branchiostoma belcheri]